MRTFTAIDTGVGLAGILSATLGRVGGHPFTLDLATLAAIAAGLMCGLMAFLAWPWIVGPRGEEPVR